MTSPRLARVGLLVNPTAGKGRAALLGARAHTALVASGHQVADLSGPTAAVAHERAAAAIAANDLDVLVTVGGDGMAHLGANLCTETRVALAIVAAGTGNDNARELGLPLLAPETAAALVTGGRTRTIDLGRCVVGDRTRWWIGVLGGGFDSIVNERAARMTWPQGAMRYNLAVLRELPTFRPIPYAITVDDQRIETEAMLVAVANGPSFGGGMRIAPDAAYDDGLLDVAIVHRISTLEFLRVFPQVFAGTHVAHPRVQVLRGRRVRLEADGIVSQADGERFEPFTLDLEVIPGALRVVT